MKKQAYELYQIAKKYVICEARSTKCASNNQMCIEKNLARGSYTIDSFQDFKQEYKLPKYSGSYDFFTYALPMVLKDFQDDKYHPTQTEPDVVHKLVPFDNKFIKDIGNSLYDSVPVISTYDTSQYSKENGNDFTDSLSNNHDNSIEYFIDFSEFDAQNLPIDYSSVASTSSCLINDFNEVVDLQIFDILQILKRFYYFAEILGTNFEKMTLKAKLS